MEFASPNLPRRLASASGALLVQGIFLLLLLYATPKFLPSAKFGHETTLILPRLQKATPLPIKTAPRMAAPPLEKRPSPGISAPITRPSTSLTPIIPPSAIQGFEQELNNCTPEKYATLPEDQQARCPPPGAGVAIQEYPNLMGSPSHVKDEAHWQDEWAREQSPIPLPCGGFINIICFLGKIADGSWRDFGDPSTWPHYAVKQLAPEDFYKIEKQYDTWNKDHSTAADTRVGPTAGK